MHTYGAGTGRLTVSVDRNKLFNRMGYRPMPHQLEYHNAEARFRVVAGGRRLGKSNMAGADRCKDLLEEKVLGWIVGPTYDLGAKEFRVMWDSLIVNMRLGHDKRVKRNFNVRQGDMYIEFPWGSRVEVRSASYKDTLVGEGLNWVIISEAAKQDEDTWPRYLRAALSDKRGEADFVSTPEGKNWFYDMWKMGLSRPEYWSRQWPSWVNREVYPGGEDDPEIIQMRETTLEEWFDQEIAAKFTAVVGRILPEFDETVHVQQHTYNPDWKNYIAFDWGYANPLAAVEFQVAPDDSVHVWREHYHSFRTLEWHVETIKQRLNPEGYRLDGAFGDVADPEAVAYVSQHLVPCVADNEAKVNWLTGIRLMKRLMKPEDTGLLDQYDRPVMRPHYYVDPSCENHISELLSYRTRTNVSANEFKGAGVVASGSDDHTIDAMRYALMHLFELGVHHLEDVYPEWAKGREERQRTTVASPQRELVGATVAHPSDSSTFFTYNGMSQRGRF